MMIERPRSLVLDLAHQLARRIADGDPPPGKAMPTQDQLSEGLSVSRTVVREAMQVLVSKGLIDIRPRIGARVRPPADWALLNNDVLAWRKEMPDRKFVQDLIDYRRLIEPEAAALASTRATQSDRENLVSRYDELERAADKGVGWVEADLAFHRQILLATHNQFVAKMAPIVEAALQASVQLTKRVPQSEQRALAIHRQVSDAVLAGDPQAARGAMTALIGEASSDLSELFSR